LLFDTAASTRHTRTTSKLDGTYSGSNGSKIKGNAGAPLLTLGNFFRHDESIDTFVL